MMTFVFAAAVLVGALCVAAALEGPVRQGCPATIAMCGLSAVPLKMREVEQLPQSRLLLKGGSQH